VCHNAAVTNIDWSVSAQAITVSSHVVFNTHLMDDKKLTECLFRNVVFVEEAAVSQAPLFQQ
jgi:hypothetical protein